MKNLKHVLPYGPNLVVQKIECRNHLLRNYGTKLATLTKNTKYPIAVRNRIKAKPKRFRCAITKAIEYHNTLEDQTEIQKIIGK